MDTDESDLHLVIRARTGDRRAFAALLDRHLPVLVTLCRRLLGDMLLAEDAAQEAALQAFLDLDRLRQPDRFGAWLMGIGLNMCRRMLRLRSQDAWSWEAMVGGSLVREPVDVTPGPEDRAESVELQARVRQAVAALPVGQRTAVLLCYLRGLSYAETALLLGIEVSAVRTRLHKARARLQQTLWSVWMEETMATEATDLVEMRVADVWQTPVEDDKPRQVLVVLAEVDGERRFAIWVGKPEGAALAIALESVDMPRPMTYTFMQRLLEACGGRLHEVRIVRLADTVFYAEAVVDGPRGLRTIDARPSDALNLAVLMHAPIRVAPAVIEEATPGGTDYTTMVRIAQEQGHPVEALPSEEQFEQIRKVIAGEISGGAAAMVAELHS